ncbi:protein translocase subunit SecF [Candidatus Parcubacteria bacterium]|nr:protein translocase subunit SecF [Candidatus Parcubacteria bacterium]
MNITKNLSYFFILPAALSIAAIIAIALWGLKPGIDLAGGSLLEVKYPAGRPNIELVRETTNKLGLGEVRVQPTGDDGLILRQRDLTVDEKNTLLQPLRNMGEMEEVQFTSIGPSIGQELMQKAWIAISLVVILTILFIAFAFRHASKPSSWKYGVVAIITLLHDILVPTGLFALLGHWYGAEVDALFIVALLTILGISINDTIVVFDRIRENLALNDEKRRHEEFEQVVDRSIRQTIARSINTSVTVVIVLLSLYFFGPESTKSFALTLTVGMIAGTYSSIFLASPLLVVWEKFSRRVK